MANHEKHKIEYYICDENNNDSGYSFCYFQKDRWLTASSFFMSIFISITLLPPFL